MRDVVDETGRWFDAGLPFALATVVDTWGSSPRGPGASMALGPDGEVVGSVSGGCVEGAVLEVAERVLADGEPRLETYGVSDEDAFEVGLTCGGTLRVLVERVDAASFPQFGRVRDAVRARRAVAVATALPPRRGRLVVGPDSPPGDGAADDGAADDGERGPGDQQRSDPGTGGLGDPGLDHALRGAARGLLEGGRSAVVRTGPQGQQREDSVAVFVEALAPPPTTLVYGAIDFAGAVVRAAKLLGHHVVLCDARPVFATGRRFPQADEVVVAWPHEHLAELTAAGLVDARTAVCVLTHDPKFDVPLLEVALRGPAGYVGAMGSRATHEDRWARLVERGLGEAELARLSSPIGLDLGARTPEETAVSILAEVVATTWGGTGRRLRDLDGPLHR